MARAGDYARTQSSFEGWRHILRRPNVPTGSLARWAARLVKTARDVTLLAAFAT
jgi:hypothetical protein